MHTAQISSRRRNQVLASLARTDAQMRGAPGYVGDWTITIGDVDLPAFISDGILYVQAPLPSVFKAFAEDVSEFICDMEIRVSKEGGPAFSLDSNGRPVPGTPVAKPLVVRRRRQR